MDSPSSWPEEIGSTHPGVKGIGSMPAALIQAFYHLSTTKFWTRFTFRYCAMALVCCPHHVFTGHFNSSCVLYGFKPTLAYWEFTCDAESGWSCIILHGPSLLQIATLPLVNILLMRRLSILHSA